MHTASSPRTKSLTSGLPQSLASGLKGTAVPYGEGIGAAKDGMKASCYIRGRSGGLGSGCLTQSDSLPREVVPTGAHVLSDSL